MPRPLSEKTSILSAIAFLIGITTLSQPVTAQAPGGRHVIQSELVGSDSNSGFGSDCALLGDLNGDGHSEWIVGESTYDSLQHIDAGRAVVYSGADHSVLYQYIGEENSDYFGKFVEGFGDLDADGINDFAVTGTATGVVHVYSGASGSELHSIAGNPAERFGWRLAETGDLNQDGHDDFLVSAHFAETGLSSGKEGALYVYSGADASLLRTIEGQHPSGSLGFAMDGLADFNLDGVPDIVVSVANETVGNLWGVGAIYVYSGLNGAELLHYVGYDEGASMGLSIATLPDLNGDGIPEILSSTTGAFDRGAIHGSAFVHSGATGLSLLRLDEYDPHFEFGRECVALGDITGDGYADFAVAAAHSDNSSGVISAGRVNFYSGREGNLIHTIFGEADRERRGHALDAGHDIDGDGKADFLVSAHQPIQFFADNGIATVYSYESFIEISQPSLSVALGGTSSIELSFPVSEANKDYAVLASLRKPGVTVLQGVGIPLERDYIFDRMIAADAPPQFQDEIGTLDSSGRATAKVVIPANSSAGLIGRQVSLAAVSFDANGVRGSSGSVRIDLLP